MLKKLFRPAVDNFLVSACQKTLHKHKTKIIVVTGDGFTSIARELIYEILREKYPVRRSLESSESEFSIPLTVLGVNLYPKSFWEWANTLLKVSYNLKNQKPYEHFLIIEVNLTIEKQLKKWMGILKPETLFIVGKAGFDYSDFSFKKIVKINAQTTDDILIPFKIGINQIGKFYRIDESKIVDVFDKFELPDTKIRFLKGVNNSFIIDATQTLIPTNIDTVVELIPQEETSRKIIITEFKTDTSALKKDGFIINPPKYSPKEGDIIILRGNRHRVHQKYAYLISEYDGL